MSSAGLRLTRTGRTFSLTPLSGHVDSACTGDAECQRRATHRLLSRRTASVEWLCDAHAESWLRDQGLTNTGASAPEAGHHDRSG